jgi:hypothetical protein
MRSLLKWLAAAALAIGGLSALAGQLPPRIRLLGLFAIGFGLLSGGCAAALADGFEVRRSPLAAAAVCALTAAGFANIAWAGYRQTQAAAARAVAADAQQLLALRLLESTMDVDPVVQRRYREERARLQPGFHDYLARRLSRFGTPPAPWPEIESGLEVLLGAAAAAWIFLRKSWRQSPDLSEKSELRTSKSEMVERPITTEPLNSSPLDPRL